MIIQTMPYPPSSSAGISYVGGAKGIATGSTSNLSFSSLSGGIASSPSEDDFVVLVTCVSGFSTLGTPTNYTSQFNSGRLNNPSTGAKATVAVATRRLGAGETSTGNYAGTGSYAAMVFRGVDTTTPLDVAIVTGTNVSETRPNPGAITPVTSGAMIVACGGAVGYFELDPFTSSNLDGFITETDDVDGFEPTVGIGYKEWDGLGAFDPAQFGGGDPDSPTSAPSAWLTLALRPT